MTKLVICCDGTWNTPDQNDRGVPAPTNVVRLYNAVAQTADQKRYYHPGVGTDGTWWDKAVAGGTDVGGGYHEAGLADGALRWMIDEAQAAGLAFNDRMVAQIAPNVLDMMHDSCTLPFSAFPTQPRAIPSLRTTPSAQAMLAAPVRTVFHPSALQRHEVPSIHQSPYRQPHATPDPNGVDVEVFARQQWNPTGIWLEDGQRYRFAATGEWTDGSLRCGPAGTRDGHFALGEVAHLAGGVLGAVETGLRRLTGDNAVDVPFTRRHEEFPWFCLVGAVANGGGADPKGRIQPHESFHIGAGQTFTPQRSGNLYAYTNDAWHFYGNNRGKVDLRVATA